MRHMSAMSRCASASAARERRLFAHARHERGDARLHGVPAGKVMSAAAMKAMTRRSFRTKPEFSK